MGTDVAETRESRGVPTLAIDCDVHLPAPTVAELGPYLPTYWRDYFQMAGFHGAQSAIKSSYPEVFQHDFGWDQSSEERQLRRCVTTAEASHPAGSPSDLLLSRVYPGLEAVRHPDMSATLASAVNDWLSDQVLGLSDKIRGSIVVSPHEPQLAAAEIERLGGDDRFVQVVVPVRGDDPYGSRRFFPIYQAAVAHGLVVAFHYGGFSVNPSLSNGWPSYYMEEYVGMAHIFQTQMASLVLGGAFQEFPDLRVVFIDAGFAWVPSFMWRLDKDWKGLWREVPWVDRLPSEYVREHFRLTLSPLDRPQDAAQCAEVLEQIGCDTFLLYATGRPGSWEHEDVAALVDMVPEALKPGLHGRNAQMFYPRLRG